MIKSVRKHVDFSPNQNGRRMVHTLIRCLFVSDFLARSDKFEILLLMVDCSTEGGALRVMCIMLIKAKNQ